MAEETPNPAPGGEEKSPVFQTGMGAFDRAGFNKTFAETKGLGVKDEDIEKSKTADKVFNEASKYYKQKYDEAIKKIDPAFDPKIAESSEVGELTYNSNQRSIKKQIDEGKPLDGVKDIVPLAQEAAENKISLVNELKTGTVTSIAEYVGLKSIKDEDSYEEVSEEFNKSVPGAKFEEILSKFWKNMSVFNSDQPGIEAAVQKLYTPENNAIISALAKILEKTGFSSESVKNMSKRFDENLAKFAEKEGGKIEGVVATVAGVTGTTGAGTTGTATGATAVKGEQKIETKLGKKGKETEGKKEPEKIEGTKEGGKKEETATSAPKAETTKAEITEKKGIESAVGKEPTKTAEAKTQEAKTAEPKGAENKQVVDFAKSLIPSGTQETGKKSTTETGKPEIAKAEEKVGEKAKEGEKTTPTTEKGEQKIEESKPKDSRTDFIKSLFGGMLGGTTTSTTTGTGTTIESSKEELNTTVTAKVAESKMESTKPQVSEKIEKKSETIPGGGSIKETASQKLATPSVASSTKTEKATTGEVSSEPSKTTAPGETTTSPTTSGTEEKKEAASEKKEGGGEGLEAKMDSVIALLSQLNATLQGPLLTINSSKKFE